MTKGRSSACSSAASGRGGANSPLLNPVRIDGLARLVLNWPAGFIVADAARDGARRELVLHSVERGVYALLKPSGAP
ncbi:hypothetical protein FBR01_20940 [Anaerolineae bacterium CFX8]|nr:hypothetical protein [Anaerolineae bacterium CFX8]